MIRLWASRYNRGDNRLTEEAYEPRQRADLLVWCQDLTSKDPPRITSVAPGRTMLGGRWICTPGRSDGNFPTAEFVASGKGCSCRKRRSLEG
jgi:hypothetical protein